MDRDPRFQVRQFPTHETRYGLLTLIVWASVASTVVFPAIVYVALQSQGDAGSLPLLIAAVCFLSGLASTALLARSGVWISEHGLRSRFFIMQQTIEWHDVRSFGIADGSTVVLERKNGAPLRLPLKLYSRSAALRADLVRHLGEPQTVTLPKDTSGWTP